MTAKWHNVKCERKWEFHKITRRPIELPHRNSPKYLCKPPAILYSTMKLFTAILAALSLLLAVCAANGGTVAEEDPTSIYFSLMVSSAPALDITGVVSAVDQVLDAINSDSTILPGYRLQYSSVLDTQVGRICQIIIFSMVYFRRC